MLIFRGVMGCLGHGFLFPPLELDRYSLSVELLLPLKKVELTGKDVIFKGPLLTNQWLAAIKT